VKTFHDADARVVDHLPGSGRHQGRLGALAVELADGTRFSVGTGFSDAQRENPPAIGSTITFRYQELSDRGVPRFPSFVRLRTDAVASVAAPAESAKPQPFSRRAAASPTSPQPQAADVATAPSPGGKRYFELVDGKSAKFWEISQAGCDVTVRYGRLGAGGQTQVKTFGGEDAAVAHATKLIGEKTAKGYVEK
jgi:DNA ligase-1